MTITKQQTPYELLVRWNNGLVAGAHFKFLETLFETDAAGVVTVLYEKESDAQPVSMAGGADFPLADILNLAQSTALATAEAATSALATEQAAHAATKALLAESKALLAASIQ